MDIGLAAHISPWCRNLALQLERLLLQCLKLLVINLTERIIGRVSLLVVCCNKFTLVCELGSERAFTNQAGRQPYRKELVVTLKLLVAASSARCVGPHAVRVSATPRRHPRLPLPAAESSSRSLFSSP